MFFITCNIMQCALMAVVEVAITQIIESNSLQDINESILNTPCVANTMVTVYNGIK